MGLHDGRCNGPYVKPCIEYADDRTNIRLYQWCPACLAKLSDRLNHQPLEVNTPIRFDVTRFSELARRWIALGPLEVEDRSGKYYGTHVIDSEGNEVIEFWAATGAPSSREKKRFGNWTQERWDEYISDSHWECEADYQAAIEFVALSKALAESK